MKTLFQQQRHFLRLNAHRLPKLFFSDQSWFSTNQNPPINYSSSSFTNAKFSIIANLLSDPTITFSSSLHSALDKTQVDPDPDMLQAIFLRFDSSPRLLHGLFLWAEKRPGFESSDTLFDSMVNVLGKSRSFEEAWSLVLDRIGDDGGREGSNLVSVNTFVILIRRYARAGMAQAAIRTFEFASSLDQICSSDEKTNLFETMLDSVCKEGHVRVASEYFTRKKQTDLCWVPSIKVYNILLNGWFRSGKLKHAERLWSNMKKNGVLPSVVTYGTLIEGYCTMRRVERAVELVDEMKEVGMELNAKVYNPIIDSLGEAGRLKEALGMME
ncbi:pentatricopeptide repeat-containing protein At5g11310, mitochondrial-like [Hibiscus syriacus]|uniref:pentatricopeptide repeat-containing protein At5g11310, mitochondrial-like n=1 Tax=Hibiscus syriacus TaxID=106335 RepID=UPI001923BB12|nr:pentatricopeptide repeat-containing protein At5g11310, mitochondrial-like [Hibiscus syriacus]